MILFKAIFKTFHLIYLRYKRQEVPDEDDSDNMDDDERTRLLGTDQPSMQTWCYNMLNSKLTHVT